MKYLLIFIVGLLLGLLYGRLLGYSNERLFELSQNIIGGNRVAFFENAYNLSYTDIYDFASAGNKMDAKDGFVLQLPYIEKKEEKYEK